MTFLDKLIVGLIYIFIALLPIVPDKLKYKNIPISTDLLLGVIIILFLLKSLLIGKNRRRFFDSIKDFFHDYSLVFMFILFLVMLISVSYAYDKHMALKETARFLSYICLLFMLKYNGNTKKANEIFIKLYVVICSYLCLYGIVQYFTGFGLNGKFTGYKYTKERVAASLNNPNSFAAFLILGFFPIFMLMLNEKKKSKKLFLLLVCSLMVVNIIFTGSRNALIGFFIGFLMLVILYSRKIIYYLLVLIPTAFIIPQTRVRILGLSDSTQNNSRIKLWETAIKMIKNNPIFGVGNGNYVSLYDTYVKRYPELVYPDYKEFASHNSYLKVQSELGIAGTVSFISFLYFAFKKVYDYIKVSTDNMFKSFFTGFLASFAAFLVMNLSDNLFFVPKATTFFWLLFGICQSLQFIDTKKLV